MSRPLAGKVALVTGASSGIGAACAFAIAEAGATSIRDMGRVMAVLKGKYTGQMDFGAVGPKVKDLLG